MHYVNFNSYQTGQNEFKDGLPSKGKNGMWVNMTGLVVRASAICYGQLCNCQGVNGLKTLKLTFAGAVIPKVRSLRGSRNIIY